MFLLVYFFPSSLSTVDKLLTKHNLFLIKHKYIGYYNFDKKHSQNINKDIWILIFLNHKFVQIKIES